MLNFKTGREIARIRKKKDVYVLKIKDKHESSTPDDEDVGEVEQKFSFVEKLMLMNKSELRDAIKLNPNIKLRLEQELNNEYCNYPIKAGGSEIEAVRGAKFMFTFDTHADREVCYIFSKSGSGKSVLCRKYIKEYWLEYPDNDVFLFSLKDADPAFDDLEGLHRIPIEEKVLKAVDLDTLKNSLVIFDDTESERKEAWSTEIMRIKDEIVQRGRSLKIFCVITTHMASNFNKTRVILNEADKLISFPGRVSDAHFRYLFTKHAGLEKAVVDKMLRLNTRWVCYDRNYPQNVVYDSGAFVVRSTAD